MYSVCFRLGGCFFSQKASGIRKGILQGSTSQLNQPNPKGKKISEMDDGVVSRGEALWDEISEEAHKKSTHPVIHKIARRITNALLQQKKLENNFPRGSGFPGIGTSFFDEFWMLEILTWEVSSLDPKLGIYDGYDEHSQSQKFFVETSVNFCSP